MGAKIVDMLTDNSHISKLKVDQLKAVLAFKAVELPSDSRKPALVSLVQEKLKLPSVETPPPLPNLEGSQTAPGSRSDEVGSSSATPANEVEAEEDEVEAEEDHSSEEDSDEEDS